MQIPICVWIFLAVRFGLRNSDSLLQIQSKNTFSNVDIKRRNLRLDPLLLYIN